MPFDYAYWGDYSYTSMDPDGLRIWTIQQYAVAGDYWGTQVTAIKPFAGGP
jgi:starvation-inducible outer membrane lipoprotein